MNKDLILHIAQAMSNKPSANFSAEDINKAAVVELLKEIGLSEKASLREIREASPRAFSIIEEAIDETLPGKLQDVFGGFAEIRQYARDQEVIFNIEKIGRGRAKLVISKGARAGIYRAARLDSKDFPVKTETYTAAVYRNLEDLLLGYVSLSDMYQDIVEGFEEEIMKDVFNALASGATVAGYGRIGADPDSTYLSTDKESLINALDKVIPYVKAYGVPTIFGSYAALANIYNPVVGTSWALNQDAADIRENGFVKVYKGIRVVEVPNYLVDLNNDKWLYDPSYVFVVPSDLKPVKIAMKGETYIKENSDAVGGEKWNAHKMMGVGIAMANNFAVIKISDLVEEGEKFAVSERNATDYNHPYKAN